jgi:hypothetical protein
MNGRIISSVDDIHRLLMTLPPNPALDTQIVRSGVLRSVTVDAN